MSEPELETQSAKHREGDTDWERLRAMTEEQIEAGASGDPENPPWTEAELVAAELRTPSEEATAPASRQRDREES